MKRVKLCIFIATQLVLTSACIGCGSEKLTADEKAEYYKLKGQVGAQVELQSEVSLDNDTKITNKELYKEFMLFYINHNNMEDAEFLNEINKYKSIISADIESELYEDYNKNGVGLVSKGTNDNVSDESITAENSIVIKFSASGQSIIRFNIMSGKYKGKAFDISRSDIDKYVEYKNIDNTFILKLKSSSDSVLTYDEKNDSVVTNVDSIETIENYSDDYSYLLSNDTDSKKEEITSESETESEITKYKVVSCETYSNMIVTKVNHLSNTTLYKLELDVNDKISSITKYEFSK